MSSTVTSEPAASDSNESAPAPAKPTSTKKKRTWRRFFLVAALGVLALAVIGRVIIAVAFPAVLKKVAGMYDLDASYSRMELYLLGGDVGLWDLTIRPKGGGEALMAVDYTRGDVSALNLLRGRLVVHRAELDGMQLKVQRDADGRIPALEKLLAPSPAATDNQPMNLSLDTGLRLDAVRVNRMRAKWTDRSVTPLVETDLEMTLRLSDFGSPTQPMNILIEATSPPLLDTLRVEGGGTIKGQALDAKLDVLVRGLHPRPASGYLAALGVRPVGEAINLTCAATVKTRAAGPAPSATQPADIAGTIIFEKIAARADGQEAAGVDRVVIDADAINGRAARIARVTIDGVRANAARTADGNIRFAGLELGPTPTPTTRPAQAAAAAAAAAPSPASPATQPAGAPVALALGELAIRNVRATFRDDTVTPAADLAFVVDQLAVKDLDSARPDAPVQITGQFSAPGVAKSIRLTGTARPFAQTRRLDGTIVVEGIKPDALRGYIEPAGVESTFKDGTLTAELRAALAMAADGGINADARLANIKLTDGSELLMFDAAHLSGVSINPATARVRVEAVDITGPRLVAHRAADGTISALGLRTTPATQPAPPATPAVAAAKPAATQPSAPTVASAAPDSASSPPPPKIELGRLTWKGVDVQLADQAVTPATNLRINQAGVELANIVIDLDPAAKPPGTPGRVRAWMAASGIADALNIDGVVTRTGTTANRTVTADLNVTGKGLRGEILAPYLKAAGIEPALKNGSLNMRTRLSLARKADDAIAASLAVEDLRYADADQELVGVKALKVDDVALTKDGVAIAAVTLTQPRALAQRNPDGSFSVAGVRVNAPATQPAAVDTKPPPPEPKLASAAPATQPAPAATPPFVATLGQLRVSDAAITWADRAVTPAVDAVAHANVDVDRFVFGRDDAAPAAVKIMAKIDPLAEFSAAGTVSASTTSPSVQLDLAGHGIRGAVLGQYLPPGTTVALKDGRFRARLEAAASPNPKGGQTARLIVSNVDYREGEAATPLLAFDGARVLVSRVDVPGKVVAIDEVSLAGLQTEARRTADGSMNLLGVRIAPASTPPASSADAAPLPVAVKAPSPSPAPAPGAVAPASTQPSGTADVNRLIAASHEKMPLVTLEKLDVNLKRVAYIDESKPADAKPISLADVRLRNRARIELLGDDPQSRPPVDLELTGAVDPIVGNFKVATQAAPFASQPTLRVTVDAKGINGEGVVAAMPELREQLAAQPMNDGRFAAALEATAKVAKRGPAEYDFTKPMEVSATVRDVAFRADSAADSPILAGVQEVRADGVRIDPEKGSVVARTVEITRPIGRAWRDKDGIHALGLVIKDPTTKPAGSTTQPSEPTPAPKGEAVLASGSSTANGNGSAVASAKPEAEIAIEKLVISGIDLTVQDLTSDPPFVAPINSLEVEVRGLSNMAMYEPRPIRFNMTAGADKVELVNRPPGEMFSEVAASGNVTLYPKVRGWARSNVSGMELLSLRGPAAEQKVTIEGGVFDSRVDVRFREDGVLDTRSRFAFSDLRVSEPPGGVVQKYLQLSGPLDVVIVVLQDTSGAITVPLNLTIKEGEVGGGQIAGAAVGAVASIVATAMASTPLKVAGGVTELVGLDDALGLGKKKPTGPQSAGELAFYAGAGEASSPSESTITLDELKNRMRKDKQLEVTLRHELGGGDVLLASQRANPSSDEAMALATQLRQRKADLLAQRAGLGAAARATLAADPAAARETINQLRDVDRQLAATEDALDRVFELLRPGAQRHGERRTRAASLKIAEARLNAVKELLAAGGVTDVENRVKIIRPQFTAATGTEGGRVTMVVTSKKKP